MPQEPSSAIDDSLTSMARLTNQLLALGQVEHDRAARQRERVDLGPVVRDVVAEVGAAGARSWRRTGLRERRTMPGRGNRPAGPGTRPQPRRQCHSLCGSGPTADRIGAQDWPMQPDKASTTTEPASMREDRRELRRRFSRGRTDHDRRKRPRAVHRGRDRGDVRRIVGTAAAGKGTGLFGVVSLPLAPIERIGKFRAAEAVRRYRFAFALSTNVVV